MLGLVNGSTGIIIDFVYFTKKAPDLPEYIIINFPEYTGPAFFDGTERSTWVPLYPETVEWQDYSDKKAHFRTQYPISLAWALTTWKAQGMTCSKKVYAPFAPTERQAGLSYVNESRLENMDNLCIGSAIPLERLTYKISSCKGMDSRIEEDIRLANLWESTKTFFGMY